MTDKTREIIKELEEIEKRMSMSMATDRFCSPLKNIIPKLEQELEGNKAVLEIVKDLAKWSEKYPRGRTYRTSQQPEMDGELIKIEERATQAIKKEG